MHTQSDGFDPEELNPWQKASSIFMWICLISPESKLVAFGAAVGALAGQYLAREMLNLTQPVTFKLSSF